MARRYKLEGDELVSIHKTRKKTNKNSLVDGQNKEQKTNSNDINEQIKQGYAEALKESIKQGELQKNRFEEMVETSEIELYRVKSSQLLDLYPTEVVIDLNKVSIIKKQFMSERIQSVFVQDIGDIYVTTSLTSATLHILDNNFKDNTLAVTNLKKDGATKLRKIIQGLIVIKKQQIDVSKLEGVENLVDKLEKLGEIKYGKN